MASSEEVSLSAGNKQTRHQNSPSTISTSTSTSVSLYTEESTNRQVIGSVITPRPLQLWITPGEPASAKLQRQPPSKPTTLNTAASAEEQVITSPGKQTHHHHHYHHYRPNHISHNSSNHSECHNSREKEQRVPLFAQHAHHRINHLQQRARARSQNSASAAALDMSVVRPASGHSNGSMPTAPADLNPEATIFVGPTCELTSNTGGTQQSASLIVDHLYVGEQLDTSVERLRALDIKYLLSFQTLPLFLDTASATTATASCNHTDKIDSVRSEAQQVRIYIHDQHVDCDQAERYIRNSLEVPNSSLDYCIQLPTSSKNVDETSSSKITTAATAKHCKARSHSNKKDQQSSSSSSSLKIRAKCVNVNDTHDQRLDAFFDECLTFIDEALASKSNILIHCKAGISRSPTVAIAYMIRAHQCSLALAYHHVKCRRQQISPNLNFMGQLYAYEQQLSKVRANPNATAPITVGGGIASAHQQQQAQQPAMRSPVLSPSTVAQRTPS